jgi:hypothetical protein
MAEEVVEEEVVEEEVAENVDDEVAIDDDKVDNDENPDHFSSTFKDEKLKKLASRYTTVEEMAKGTLSLRQKVSGKSGPIDLGKADEVEVAEFRKSWGIPDTPDGYEFPKPPEGVDTEENKAAVEKWQGVFHKHNISKEAAQDILREYGEEVIANQGRLGDLDKQFADATDAEIRKDWGSDYDVNKSFANHAVKEMFGDTMEDVQHIQQADGRYILDHPAFVKAFAQFGREMSEGNLSLGNLSEDALTSLGEKADSYRSKAKEAQEAGKSSDANKWSLKEREVLEQIAKAEQKR